ncbi:type IV pilin [Methanolobus profundi]|uniref:type IV pilin n=1 Tax=Methanolobus profundi TaxID=487685 RepID=UPI0011603A1F|nr:type IV pilin N-terminal domain-containing protein [Methanolobus profundi]
MEKQILDVWVNREAISPIIGVILMLLLTVLLAGITVSAVYGDDMVSSLKEAPMASIEVEHVDGGLPKYPTYVGYKKNFLYLDHMGGDPLPADSIRLIISGDGSSYSGVFGSGTTLYGDLIITYDDLMFEGKIPKYASRNPCLSDGVWSTGESLVLNGDDSINGTSASSVYVSINGITETSNNYGLEEDTWITVKIFDKDTQRIISESECYVSLVK